MGFSGTFSLHAHTRILSPSFPENHKLFCKSLNSLEKPNSLSLRFKSNTPSKLCTHFSYSPPFSVFSNCRPALSPQKNLHQILIGKVVGFLIVSVIFVGLFNVRAAMALLPSRISSSSVKLEEDRDAQDGKSEDEELYEKILEKEPRNIEALKVVLYGKMRRGKTKEAVKYVEKLIDIEPNEVEWRLLLALCYEIMGQLSTAKRLFKEI